MSGKAMSLKAKLNNYAIKHHIAPQVVMQNYMFERFLLRLSQSPYRDQFVLKGGMLIASIVGLDTRSTMDLDATIRQLPLTEERLTEAILSISNIESDDNISFQFVSIAPIRDDDQYGGFRIRLNAIFETIVTPLSLDISTGDVITPRAMRYRFIGFLDNTLSFDLWGYNPETILAEKVETILRRGVLSTRPRDLYDVYILSATQMINSETFAAALQATAKHRGSWTLIQDTAAILESLQNSSDQRAQWTKYQKKFSYATTISYDDTLNAVRRLVLLEESCDNK